MELKRETQTERDGRGLGEGEEKRRDRQGGVCVVKKKNRETEGYICATDAVAVEIQTPNTADKNAG